MPGGFHTFGQFWCPRCCGREYFDMFGDPSALGLPRSVHPANMAECRSCGYQFGTKKKERKNEPGIFDDVGVLSEDAINRARQGLRAEGVLRDGNTSRS